jgi:hexosaminidase
VQSSIFKYYYNVKTYGNLKALDWYKSHGLKVMAANAAQCMEPMLPRDNSMFQPIKDFCEITGEKKLEGILCTTWDDSSPHFETLWRGIYDFAFISWNYENITAEEAHAIFRHRFYGPALSDASFEFEDLLEEALTFWCTALNADQLVNKSRSQAPRMLDPLELPDSLKSGEWSQKK